MWAAFKALSIQVKLGVVIALIATLVAFSVAVYTTGYQKGVNIAAVQISRYESKSAQLQANIAKLQTRVDVRYVTEYKDRVNYVDRVVYKTRDVVRDNVPEQFNLSKGWIYAYNQSVQGLEVDPVLAADKSPSSVSEMRALADTIVPNNGRFLSTKAQLDALQGWVRGTQETTNAKPNN